MITCETILVIERDAPKDDATIRPPDPTQPLWSLSIMKPISVLATLVFVFPLLAGCDKEKPSTSAPPSSGALPVSLPAVSASAEVAGPVAHHPLKSPSVLFRDQDRPVAVEVHEQFVYWINAGTGLDKRLERAKGQVLRGPKTGGEPTVLFSGENLPDSLVREDRNLYWTSEYDVRGGPIEGGKAALSFDGSELFGSPMALVVRDGRLVFGIIHPDAGGVHVIDPMGKRLLEPVPVVGGVSALAVTRDAVFAYSRQQRAIGRFALSGGPPKSVLSDVKGCATMVTDDAKVYWTEPGDGRIRSMSVEGGEVATVSAGFKRPWDLLLDGEALMVTDREAGTIVQVPKKGGRGTILAEGQGAPHSIAVDEAFVYWTEPEKGMVSRTPKLRP